MPNRIIRESLRTSEKISSLTDFEFRLWIGLITSVDDFGRGDARPAIIKGQVFPLRERVSIKDIESALHGLAAKGCISFYDVDGKSYFWFPTWSTHQRIQTKKSKYPEPVANTQHFEEKNDSTVIHGDSPPESNPNPIRIQSESESESEYSSEQLAASAPKVIVLPLNTGEEWPVTQDMVDKWSGLYQAVDVVLELRKMYGWLDSNPKNRKTKSGVKTFVTGWLARAQDKGGTRAATQKAETTRKTFSELIAEQEVKT